MSVYKPSYLSPLGCESNAMLRDSNGRCYYPAIPQANVAPINNPPLFAPLVSGGGGGGGSVVSYRGSGAGSAMTQLPTEVQQQIQQEAPVEIKNYLPWILGIGLVIYFFTKKGP